MLFGGLTQWIGHVNSDINGYSMSSNFTSFDSTRTSILQIYSFLSKYDRWIKYTHNVRNDQGDGMQAQASIYLQTGRQDQRRQASSGSDTGAV